LGLDSSAVIGPGTKGIGPGTKGIGPGTKGTGPDVIAVSRDVVSWSGVPLGRFEIHRGIPL
jgi:hypothetical protein